ncbi:GYDIA family GHMP kinase [Gramella sp. AN32]|uniref:GYDIA family GHMP kinase n=1 Tax=Christiangramia antarctica TaxID=2058158 RepID=A0ABW5X2K3_9FLAO|nr:GYDIA family GHMP kinase [Gramella sp. AN32]MCM4156663.1 GHMP kinase [Gramella sp. AN32]
MKEFRSNGKILLTGEYAVLDGAKALTLPTKMGQNMQISKKNDGNLNWKSKDENGRIWFETSLSIKNNKFETSNSSPAEYKKLEERLVQTLNAALLQKPGFAQNFPGYDIMTQLDFNRNWGLGSSSTLINNLANWLKIDAYELLQNTFGGSGYDLAAANSDFPITYQVTADGPRDFVVSFDPPFKDNLYFIYLNQKQDSRESIKHYRNQQSEKRNELVDKISGITEQIIQTENLEEFKLLLEAHETLLSLALNLPKVKNKLFPDYSGLVKSLGGWGGDFVLVTGSENEMDYFRKKGYSTIFSYRDFIK